MMIGKVKIDLFGGGYDSPEDCKAKLLAVINADHFPNEFLLNHAIEVRKKEIRWRWLWIPMVMFAFLVVYLLYGALFFHVPKYVYLSLVLIIILVIVFRITFYQSYLNIYNRLSLTAASLKDEIPQVPKTKTPDKSFFLQTRKPGLQQQPAIEERAPAEKKEYGKELDLFFAKAGDHEVKGRIKILLLDQLVRKECNRASIFDVLSRDIDRSVDIQGCKAKNVASQMQYYNSRKSIKLKKTHSQTTHLKYLSYLQEYYREIGEPMLEKQAEDLYYFIDLMKIE